MALEIVSRSNQVEFKINHSALARQLQICFGFRKLKPG